MRIPHFINNNTQIAYTPSKETKGLIAEQGRTITPEDFEWDNDFISTLETKCVEAISRYFKDKPLLNELPCADKEHLLEILPIDLPLELVIPLIEDEIYWERRYTHEFGQFNKRKHVQWTWKCVYLERFLQQKVEEAQPQYQDEEQMEDLLKLLNPYVTNLKVTHLQPWKPPLIWEPDEIPEKWPIAHINFEPILSKLENIVSLDIVFGVKEDWEKYRKSFFDISVNDCKNLGKAILYLPKINVLKIHRSRIEDKHVQALMKQLINNQTITELDMSHCLIRDSGALCIAKLMMTHPALKILKLTNNRIEGKGGLGIGFAMTQETCCPIEHLDLRLNPLGHEGTMGILRASVRVPLPAVHLSLAGCYFEDETALRLGQMLGLNVSIKDLDVSNNYFDDNAVEAVLKGMQFNRTIEKLDMRETDIEEEDQAKINKLLLRNKLNLPDEEEELVEEREEEVAVVEAEDQAVNVKEGKDDDESSSSSNESKEETETGDADREEAGGDKE